MNIGIVGLGLIGGSLGLDLRDQGYRVLGVSQRATTCETAIDRGVVDQASPDLALLQSADVIFLCTPIALIVPTIQALIPQIPSDTIITDVGSVKAEIIEAVAPLWPNFVGGHPMAGTADSGINAAMRNLFGGRPYVLTPIASTSEIAVQTVTALIRSLGAQVLLCDPQAHDRAVAWISHLPVMVSASLLSACALESDPEVQTLAHALAGSGFRDTSRVGGGNPELGRMMAEFNRDALVRSLLTYRQQLDHYIELIQEQNWDALATKLEHTQAERGKFLNL
jgi:arogenate dehydrogenase (NADP+)